MENEFKGKAPDKIKIKNVLGEILRTPNIDTVIEPWLLEAIRWHRKNFIRYEGVNARKIKDKYRSNGKVKNW